MYMHAFYVCMHVCHRYACVPELKASGSESLQNWENCVSVYACILCVCVKIV